MRIPKDNVWQTSRTIRDGRDWLYENRLHYTAWLPAAGETYLLQFRQNGGKADVNSDGVVDVGDIAAVIDCMAGKGIVTIRKADVNDDGMADVADIATIIDVMSAY